MPQQDAQLRPTRSKAVWILEHMLLVLSSCCVLIPDLTIPVRALLLVPALISAGFVTSLWIERRRNQPAATRPSAAQTSLPPSHL